MIQNIAVDMLCPHPQNPRKDLGDLEELAESIKANGILQNLTVVPWFSEITGKGADDPKQQAEMGYRIVIGHRRFAAARKAGLKEVPCVISDMDKKTQVATMLLENIQRNDLTVYEQAQGFQMMMDLGDTAKDISDKTGFSAKTVQRRTKLLELDREKFKKAVDKGATLMDFEKVNRIKDPERRNKVLEHFGTSNFDWALRNAVEDEKREQRAAKIRQVLETFAEELEELDYSTMQRVHWYSFYQSNEEVPIPEDVETQEYFFIKESGGIALCIKREEPADDEAEKEAERKKMEQAMALEEVSKRAFELRKAFVLEFTGVKDFKDVIIEFAVWILTCGEWVCGADDAAEYSDNMTKTLLIAAYTAVDDEDERYTNWNGRYKKNESLDKIYDYLTGLGYQMSDDEKALQDGTHELFVKEEEE